LEPDQLQPVEPNDRLPLPAADVLPADSSLSLDRKPGNKTPHLVGAGERETVYERYPNGAVRIERHVMLDSANNYVLDGAWRMFNQRGQTTCEGEYKLGQREGYWRRTYGRDDAPLFSQPSFARFQAPFYSEAVFKNGKLDGPWTLVDSHNRKMVEIVYENGRRHGVATWWSSNGTPQIQANFENGELHGEAYVYDAAGKLASREQYDRGWRWEVATSKHANGSVSARIAEMTGPWKLKHEDDWWNATIASFEKGTQKLRHGKMVTYHPNGQVQSQREYHRGKPVGDVAWWHSNGQKAITGEFDDQGQPHGKWTWWHANGQRSTVGEYNHGQTESNWLVWNPEGKLIQQATNSEECRSVIAAGPRSTPARLGVPRPVVE
jgi:antitoxin component YwqK of YwqJK toxin-antitoxin module